MRDQPDSAKSSDQLRRQILSSPSLQQRLGRHEQPDAFEHDLRMVAQELGIIDVNIAEVARARSAVEREDWPPLGWLPARVLQGEGAPSFEWAWFGDASLIDPFFDDSVRRLASRPFSRAFRTRTAMGALVGAGEPARSPDGLIFHMSRCGSTLVAQMLAAVPDHLVLSEAPPIDAVAQWAGRAEVAEEDGVAALRAIVAALMRGSAQRYRRTFVKLDSWHVTALPLFAAAFPDTPWIFLYRDPAEVMVSHMAMPGAHFATCFGSGSDRVNPTGFMEDRGAAVLARYLDAAVEYFGAGGGMLVNYADLRASMELAIPRHFRFTPDADERSAMADAMRRNSKLPDQTYHDDRARKRAKVTPAIEAAVERHLSASYRRIEMLRQPVQAPGLARR